MPCVPTSLTTPQGQFSEPSPTFPNGNCDGESGFTDSDEIKWPSVSDEWRQLSGVPSDTVEFPPRERFVIDQKQHHGVDPVGSLPFVAQVCNNAAIPPGCWSAASMQEGTPRVPPPAELPVGINDNSFSHVHLNTPPMPHFSSLPWPSPQVQLLPQNLDGYRAQLDGVQTTPLALYHPSVPSHESPGDCAVMLVTVPSTPLTTAMVYPPPALSCAGSNPCFVVSGRERDQPITPPVADRLFTHTIFDGWSHATTVPTADQLARHTECTTKPFTSAQRASSFIPIPPWKATPAPNGTPTARAGHSICWRKTSQGSWIPLKVE